MHGEPTYQHPEAFCLMWYECEVCRARERIWNSRDGVTPFGVGCQECGNVATHVDLEKDQRVVEHALPADRRYRVFIDMPKGLEEAMVRGRIRRSQRDLTAEQAEHLVQRHMEDAEKRGPTPFLVHVFR